MEENKERKIALELRPKPLYDTIIELRCQIKEKDKEIDRLRNEVEAYKMVNTYNQDKQKRLLSIILEVPPTFEQAKEIEKQNNL
jgi:hypothetical protein